MQKLASGSNHCSEFEKPNKKMKGVLVTNLKGLVSRKMKNEKCKNVKNEKKVGKK